MRDGGSFCNAHAAWPGPGIAELLFLQPHFAERVWGGRRLKKLFGKKLPPGKAIGESWELSDRPGQQSTIVGGAFHGWTLSRLMAERREALLGRELAARNPAHFPLLAKFIDACDKLSVQVHPDDAGARRLGYADRGKTECWVIVHAEPGARINRGFNPGVTRADFRKALAGGRLEEVLHYFAVRAGDVIALPPGTVHDIGAGIVLAEIQQNSDLTFRVYDYNRPGLDGRPRELHVKEALAAMCLRGAARGFFREDVSSDKVRGVCRTAGKGVHVTSYLHGRYFDLDLITIEPGAHWRPHNWTARAAVLMCLGGRGRWREREFAAGQTMLAPADLPPEELLIRATGRKRLTVLKSSPGPAD